MRNPVLDRIARRASGSHGVKSEKRTAGRLGGRQVPASGAMQGAKGDIRLADFLVENKATEAESMSLKLEWLLKVAQEAAELGQMPALSIQFVTGDGRPRQNGRWVMIREDDFKEVSGEDS